MSFSLRALVKNSTSLFFSGLATAIFSLLQGVIVARNLGPSAYGFLAVVIGSAALFRSFFGFRTEDALTKFIVKYREEKDQLKLRTLLGVCLSIELITGTLIFLIIVISFPLLRLMTPGFYEDNWLYIVYAPVMIFSSLDILWICIVRDQRKFKLLSFGPVMIGVIQTIGVLLLFRFHELSLVGLVLLYLSVSVFKFAYYGQEIFSYISKSIHPLKVADILFKFGNWKLIDDFWRFTKSTYIASSVASIAKSADVIVLSWFSTESDVGFYRIAKSMASMSQILVSSLNSIIYRDFVEHKNQAYDVLVAVLKRVMKYAIPITIFFTSILWVIADYLIKYLYGVAYIEAISMYRTFLIGNSYALIFFWAHTLVLSKELHLVYRNTLLWGSLATLLVMMAFTYSWGGVGTALANSFGVILFTTSFVLYLTRDYFLRRQ